MNFELFLRETNRQIQAFLLRHASGIDGSAGIPAEELRDLRRCVQDVTSRTGGVATLRHHAGEAEVAAYIYNLEQLVPLLQAAQQRSMARRQQLDEKLNRLARAKAWAGAYKSTV
jgi:hypothetical protein